MILFLSHSFLRRLSLSWRSDLRALLIGHRNLFFFVPDSLKEVREFSPEVIDEFLQSHPPSNGWELLGAISPEIPNLPGMMSVVTAGNSEPQQWRVTVSIWDGDRWNEKPLEIHFEQPAVKQP